MVLAVLYWLIRSTSPGDPAVALAARNTLGEIEVIRKVDLLRGGR